MLAMLFGSCSSIKPVSPGIEPPSFEMVRPPRPLLEQVTIPQGTVIPDSMLRNYNALAMYALDLEDYAWGGDSPGGLEKYVVDIMDVYNL
ncbi:hypothetical protein [Sphaerochaeta sp.]|uniref:hypothetical protein n=1 Tax=Sphaerochaeta sp. TaxID=1972642 RepID=UPI003D0A50F1